MAGLLLPETFLGKALDDEFPTATEPTPDGSLMDQFLKGDDGFRKSRLKLIANIVKGPWIVKKAVGEQAVCLIGRALTCRNTYGGSSFSNREPNGVGASGTDFRSFIPAYAVLEFNWAGLLQPSCFRCSGEQLCV
ncbi:hypothetical protein Vadar_034357 [Vaccinium darrowii]|uniref:Uncharacterized protein n=1 Tax=Vaccinium darrowii TaxID=229202 RepID=A0ACB7X6I5_9ERIC|nr:hypothetical protein Vadar_034357 [Vaccinium darrowii]